MGVRGVESDRVALFSLRMTLPDATGEWSPMATATTSQPARALRQPSPIILLPAFTNWPHFLMSM
jgi:hypothetical protein